ncbi:MAG: leucine-rich repeat domain-containing protein [Oscillospiraceae bacterium]|jgi:hypothetical protein|nr:leucine-rich repeat domain-containing protein [Oscillospiraceae bacterium]
MKLLEDFCKKESKKAKRDFKKRYYEEHLDLKWWIVAGKGGVGKSKLCYAFVEKMIKKGWVVVFPKKSYNSNFHVELSIQSFHAALKEGQNQKRFLFVIDYIENEIEVVNKFISELQGGDYNKKKKIYRILLIARDAYDDEIEELPDDFVYRPKRNPSYALNLDDYKHSIKKDMPKIVRHWADTVKKLEKRKGEWKDEKESRYKKLQSSKKMCNKIIDDIKDIDHDFERPLYAELVVQAHLDKKAVTSRKEVLDYLYGRDTLEGKYSIAGGLIEILDDKENPSDSWWFKLAITIDAMATMMGEFNLEKDFPYLLPELYEVYLNEDEHKRNLFVEHQHKFKKTEEGYVWYKRDPSIIGEYFVIQWLNTLYEDQHFSPKKCIDASWNKPKDMTFFTQRLYEDYEKDGSLIPDEREKLEVFWHVIIPNNIEEINVNNFAFTEQQWLKRVTIPSSVKTIGEYAFAQCRELIRVYFEEGIKKIEFGAFWGCPQVNGLLPESLETVEYACFAGGSHFTPNPNSKITHEALVYANQDPIKSFGYYNDNLPIKWIVLDIKTELVENRKKVKLLLLSENAIELRKYEETLSYRGISWENCSLRRYLNSKSDFLNKYFSEAQQYRIAKTEIINNANPRYWTHAEKKINDQVFLLSITEAEQYFVTTSNRIARFTEKNKFNRKHDRNWIPENKEEKGSEVRWWLRTQGERTNKVAYINTTGVIKYEGRDANQGYIGVRPAMWVEFEFE